MLKLGIGVRTHNPFLGLRQAPISHLQFDAISIKNLYQEENSGSECLKMLTNRLSVDGNTIGDFSFLPFLFSIFPKINIQ